jgi:lipopolysaccharide transport system ATP-binding protein
MSTSIDFRNVSKKYVLGQFRGSLRQAVPGLLRKLGGRNDRQGPPEFWALRDVSFQVRPGEALGIIGPNGSGKTTTLKLISKVTEPTSGAIDVKGRLSALIELGAGFHPDLTGRENIYLNGSILGMTRQEIRQRFDAIVEFSGLEPFLDTPVKRYSSGMYCRLGFAVAAHVNPEVLLVDEVLAVGDAAFRSRCLRRMSELKADGTTIVFITHDMGYLQRLCSRAIFLYKGTIMTDGLVSETIQTYRDHAAYRAAEQTEDLGLAKRSAPSGAKRDRMGAPDAKIAITDVRFTSMGESVCEARTGAPLTIYVGYHAQCPFEGVNVEVWLYGLDGAEYATFATAWDGLGPLKLVGTGEVALHIDPVCLVPGSYFVNVALSDPAGLEKYDRRWEVDRIVVLSGPTAHGLLYQPHRWDVGLEGPDGVGPGRQ